MNDVRLTQLIDLVDQLLAATGDVSGLDWQAYKVRETRLIKALSAPEVGARISNDSGHGRNMTLGGLRSSSTGGMFGLCRNWQTAARKKIGAPTHG